ncbi:ferritin-like domain-containing protein [Haoranjiania flava]|uniref:Ferritin-like domain-containing protein n=1 Tax=Haoranjiania flava TaxID=1856322 RepID=A0AAE3IQB7_9BACT|nr:ferritin-like domain-containing protein [Haoranjiania flava]MCU7695450.1 ferritin-like domain-containing protein [Haoranjiania flava]
MAKQTTKTKATTKAGNSSVMENSEFHKFFIDELKDIYWAENNLLKALVKMRKASTSKQLAASFEKHHGETQVQLDRLKQIFELLGKKPVGKKCEAMAGIIEEGKGVIEDTEGDTMTRDAGLILAAQKAEHYEIATYGTLRVFAQHMGHTEVYDLLTQTLDEEKNCDVTLTELAESFINEQAAEE